ncbi:MAG: hypothetical protein WBR15_02830 [Gammaproteobacteria bacterium]
MKIKMLTPSASPKHVRKAGKVYEVQDAEAQTLIKAGHAQAVAGSTRVARAPVMETADEAEGGNETASKNPKKLAK